MASSPPPSLPPYPLNVIKFTPNQMESHIEIIPCSALLDYWWRGNFEKLGANRNKIFLVVANSVGKNSPWDETSIILYRKSLN